MATYLVTGGCGFIGSHLCDALLRAGHGVRVLDDLSTGSEANLPRDAVLMRGDVSDRIIVREAMTDVDACFHLAAIASVELARRDWLGTHMTNLTGTITVLEGARQRRVPVIYASSAAVYGDVADMPIREDVPTRPISAYGADKLGCELHARVAGVVHGIPTFGLRFFNVFGPRQDPTSPYSGVISIFCERIGRGAEVTIYGDGEQTRDFVPVGTVVAALLAAGNAASVEAPVTNVCTGRPTSVNALAAIVAEVCQTEARIVRGPARPGDIRHSVGSPARARAMLGLQGPGSLREAMAEVVAWTRGARSERRSARFSRPVR